jgi:hypothetical protein
MITVGFLFMVSPHVRDRSRKTWVFAHFRRFGGAKPLRFCGAFFGK